MPTQRAAKSPTAESARAFLWLFELVHRKESQTECKDTHPTNQQKEERTFDVPRAQARIGRSRNARLAAVAHRYYRLQHIRWSRNLMGNGGRWEGWFVRCMGFVAICIARRKCGRACRSHRSRLRRAGGLRRHCSSGMARADRSKPPLREGKKKRCVECRKGGRKE